MEGSALPAVTVPADVWARAGAAAGSFAALARKIGISRQALYYWRSRAIPAERVDDVVRATKGAVTRQELRPDLALKARR